MTHATRIIAAVAVLVALAAGVQAQTPEIDALRERAELGDAEAQVLLGATYADGQGVPRDDAEAVRWFSLAAEQGSAGAQFNLGAMYGSGTGVPLDYVLGHMWLSLAASRPTGEERETAAELRDLLRTQMTPEQIAEAQRLAREWDLAHPRNP